MIALPGTEILQRLVLALRCTDCRHGAVTPSWVPRWLGEVSSSPARHGATLVLDVLNASPWTRTVVTESDAPDLDISPATLSLSPHSLGQIILTRPRPQEPAPAVNTLIRVRGAHEYQLVWVLDHGPPDKHPTHIRIVDAPVLLHSWTDHFSGFAPQ